MKKAVSLAFTSRNSSFITDLMYLFTSAILGSVDGWVGGISQKPMTAFGNLAANLSFNVSSFSLISSAELLRMLLVPR